VYVSRQSPELNASASPKLSPSAFPFFSRIEVSFKACWNLGEDKKTLQ